MNIHFQGWLIRDGRYGDFEVNRVYRLTLNLILKEVERSPVLQPGIKEVGFGEYQFSGIKTYSNAELEVFDVGIGCYREIQTGGSAWPMFEGPFRGSGHFLIDEKLYVESEDRELTRARIEYNWLLKRIWLRSADVPGELDGQRGKVNHRGCSPLGYSEVKMTDGREDDWFSPEYVFSLRFLGVAS